MLLKDKMKWYGVISGGAFLVISAYMKVAYSFSDARLDNLLGYAKFTAALTAIIFGLLFFLKPQSIKFKVEWFGVISASMFLLVSTYMQMTFAFSDAWVGRLLHHLEFTAALAALTFGLLSFPKWQSYFALAVWVYSFYRFSQPAFGIS